MIVRIIQENNGEDPRNVYQRPRRTKEHTEMNTILEEINSRITEAEEQINEGGQNGGSHCCRTEYRKKKKMETA